MLTLDQKEFLRAAAQDILYDRPFSDIAREIDAVTADQRSVWDQARARGVPIIAAFSRVYSEQARALIDGAGAGELSADVADSDGLAAYARYSELTHGIDQKTSEAAMRVLVERPGTFSAAFAYFRRQRAIIEQYKAEHPQEIRRTGKVVTEATRGMAVERWLTLPFAANSSGNTRALVISEALRICIHNQTVPSAEALGQALREQVPLLLGLLTLNGQVFSNTISGREVAAENYRSILRTNCPGLYFGSWPSILERCLQTGEVPPAACKLGAVLRSDFPAQAIATSRQNGLCAGQFVLRRQAPLASAVTSTSSADATQNDAVPADGAWSAGSYQLMRGIQVAENTLFVNPEVRSALARIAEMIWA